MKLMMRTATIDKESSIFHVGLKAAAGRNIHGFPIYHGLVFVKATFRAKNQYEVAHLGLMTLTLRFAFIVRLACIVSVPMTTQRRGRGDDDRSSILLENPYGLRPFAQTGAIHRTLR